MQPEGTEPACAHCGTPIDQKHMFCSKNCAFAAVAKMDRMIGRETTIKMLTVSMKLCPDGLYPGEKADMQKFKEGKLDNSFFEIAGESHMDNDEAFMRPLGVPETSTPKVVKPSKATYYTSIDDLIESAR